MKQDVLFSNKSLQVNCWHLRGCHLEFQKLALSGGCFRIRTGPSAAA